MGSLHPPPPPLSALLIALSCSDQLTLLLLVPIIIPSNTIDIYTRLEELKTSGHSDTLTEASNLIDDLYKRGGIQNKQQYRNALDKFSSQ